MILSGLVVGTLLWANLRNPYVWVVLLVMIGFGAIGFYDDYLKVTRQSHKGFSGRLRLAIEAAIALVACVAMMRYGIAERDEARLALRSRDSRSISAGSFSCSGRSSSSRRAIPSI